MSAPRLERWVGVVVLAAVLAAAFAFASAAPAKKKKCGHHKRHCEKSKTFDRLAGHSLRRATSDVPPAVERWDFCRGGGYGYSFNAPASNGETGFSITYHGYWRVVSSQGASGVVQYTVKGFRSSEPGASPPPSPIAKTVTFGPFGIYFDGLLYSRGKARCR